METITKVYNVYTLDELSDEAKDKARDWYRMGNQFDFMGEEMQYLADELLKENKIKCDDASVYYSLANCQGDGAMIEINGTWKSYSVGVKQRGHYHHYNSKEITLESIKTGKDADEKVYNEFNALYVDICQQLERKGYDFIDAENSDECVDDNISCNEYTFDIDGNRLD